MRMFHTLLAAGIAVALLAGCKKEEAAVADPAPATAPDASATAAPAEPATAPAPTAAATAAAFDIASIAVSAAPLGAWPYVALPVGYRFGSDATKDLARVPLWTGSQLVWVEGRTFEAWIGSEQDKTYSRFELMKGIEQALTALGAVKLGSRSYDEPFYRQHEADLERFRSEFDDIRNAYWYDTDADTWVIRRADSAIWVVVQSGTDVGAIMVVEGPLPEAPAG